MPGHRQVFSYLIDPSPRQGSDKRLIFLRANDLRIPDVLYLPPRPPFPSPSRHPSLPSTLAQFRFFCLFPLVRCSAGPHSQNCEVTGNARDPAGPGRRSRHTERNSVTSVLSPPPPPPPCFCSMPPSSPHLFRKRAPERAIRLMPQGLSYTTAGPPTARERRISPWSCSGPAANSNFFYRYSLSFAEFIGGISVILNRSHTPAYSLSL